MKHILVIMPVDDTVIVKLKSSDSKEKHLAELSKKPKLVDTSDTESKGSDAWFHFEELYDES